MGRPKGIGKVPGSGRKAGTPNKATFELRSKIEEMGIDLPSMLISAIHECTPDLRAKFLLDLMEFVYSKRRPLAEEDKQIEEERPLSHYSDEELGRL